METSTSEISKIDLLLPQTQCTQCGFPRCYDYAQALLNGDADINQCPPGGGVTIKQLADYFSRTPLALNPGNGEHKPRQLAYITEAECIGCTLCIQACPVDAILGAGKLMHSVIAEECTGCELCVPPCPMDCIDLLPANVVDEKNTSPWQEYPLHLVARARDRTNARLTRIAATDSPQPLASEPATDDSNTQTETKDRRAEIRAALDRVKRRKAADKLASISITSGKS